jgi:hypothetical protein
MGRLAQYFMATIDEDLSQLEKDIRQLKIDYEQYFGGGKSRPPTETEWRIDTMIKRYSDRGAAMNYNQRFHYGNLAQTYIKYKEMFRKRLKKKEEGTVDRHFGAAAKEIEKERARKRKSEAGSGAVTELPFAISCKDPDHEKNKVEQLYAAFRSAKEQVSESTENLTLETFQQFVRQKTDELKKQKNVHEVEYIVALEGKHARLKARVKS